MKKLGIIMWLTTLLYGCTNKNIKQNESQDMGEGSGDSFPIKEMFINTDEEEGWGGDVKLSIVKISKGQADNVYVIKSLHKNDTLGFEVSISNDSSNRVTFRSLGRISDYFLNTLKTIYKDSTATTLKFAFEKEASYVNLNDFAAKQFGRVNNSPTQDLKIFIEGATEDDYAEFYFNINENEHWVEMKEKEDSYRTQVLRGLSYSN